MRPVWKMLGKAVRAVPLCERYERRGHLGWLARSSLARTTLCDAERQEMDKLRAAVSGHPHALLRLLQEAYGQRGAVKWSLINVSHSLQPTNVCLPEVERPADLVST